MTIGFYSVIRIFPRQRGNVEQAQNSEPAFRPRRAVLLTIGAPHFGQCFVGSVSVASWRNLRKYGYPPHKQEKATQTVLQQRSCCVRIGVG